MNEQLRRLYTCTHDNRVVVFDTNYKGFYDQLKNVLSNCRGYRYYSSRFNDLGEFTIDGYYFQQLV